MKVWMWYCERCSKFFKKEPLKPLRCPECWTGDLLMGPYHVDEIEFDNYKRYRDKHEPRGKRK